MTGPKNYQNMHKFKLRIKTLSLILCMHSVSRSKLEAAEKRVEFAEIQAEQDNSKAAENVKQIVLSMHHQLAEKQAAQVENQSPASVVLMQGTETKDPDPLETTSYSNQIRRQRLRH